MVFLIERGLTLNAIVRRVLVVDQGVPIACEEIHKGIKRHALIEINQRQR